MKETTFTIMKKNSYVPRHEILINSQDLIELKLMNFIYITVVADNGNQISCLLNSKESIARGHAQISKRSQEVLGKTVTSLHFITPEYETIKRGIPKVENINKDFVLACPELVKKYSEQVEIINSKNGYRMDLKIKSYPQAKSKTVYLNRYTMLLLGVKPEEKEHQLVIISNHAQYQCNILKKSWKSIKKFKKQIEYFLHKRNIFFIGYRELTVRVGYLYPFDETHNISRLHPNTRKFLGIDETDKIVVSYRENKVVLPVLDLDTKHVDQVFKIEDEFVDSHMYIGIPAASRKDLTIPNIGAIVKVRRSTSFLLFKHFNKLVLPLLGLWFTLSQFFFRVNLAFYQEILIIVVILPIIIFSALSQERAKIK